MASRPLRPPFLLPCHTDRRFAASSPICSPLPYFPSLFSPAAASIFNPPRIPAQHHVRIRLTRSRTATASTVRCMPGCPHLHVAAFIAARQTLLPVPDELSRTQANSGELRLPSPLPVTPKMAAPLPPYPPSPAEHAPNPTAPIRFAHAIF